MPFSVMLPEGLTRCKLWMRGCAAEKHVPGDALAMVSHLSTIETPRVDALLLVLPFLF